MSPSYDLYRDNILGIITAVEKIAVWNDKNGYYITWITGDGSADPYPYDEFMIELYVKTYETYRAENAI